LRKQKAALLLFERPFSVLTSIPRENITITSGACQSSGIPQNNLFAARCFYLIDKKWQLDIKAFEQAGDA